MGYGESRAQPTVLADGAASVGIADGPQLSETYQEENKNKDLLLKATVAWNKNMQ